MRYTSISRRKYYEILYIILLYIGIFYGCSDKSQIVYRVQSYETIDGQKVQIDGLDSLYAYWVCISSDLMLLQTDYHQSHFQLVDLNNLKLIRGFGEKAGPNSFNSPECFCQFIIGNDSRTEGVIIHDYGLNELSKVNLNSLGIQEGLNAKNRYKMPPVYIAKSAFLVDDNEIIIGGGGTDGIMYRYQLNSKNLTYSTVSPQLTKQYSTQGKDILYTIVSDIESEDRIFAVAYRFYNRIDLFSFEGKHIRSIYNNQPVNKDPVLMEEDIPSGDNIMYYGNIRINKGLVYLSFYGEKFSSVIQDNRTYYLIHIIDYEGNLVRAIRVERPISSFDVAPDNSAIYATVMEDDLSSNIIKISLK